MARLRTPRTPWDQLPGAPTETYAPPATTYQAPAGGTGGTAAPPPAAPPTGVDTSIAAPGPSHATKLEGFDAGKLADPSHALTSPKYAFGQAVESGQYGYDDGEKLLYDLQQKYGDLFGGWVLEGDKFRYKGDPNKLHSSWEGVDEVDYVRNFSQGDSFDPSQSAFWWGATSPQSRMADQMGQSPIPMSPFDPGANQGASGGFGVRTGGMTGGGSTTSMQSGPPADVQGILRQLIQSGGGMNQDILTRRVEGARQTLERSRRSQMATDRAMLAERGLLGSGPEISAVDRLSQDLSDRYADEVSSIYADEGRAADSRMIEALSLMTGMTLEQSRQAIDQYRAETERSLGEQNVGLGYYRAGNDFTLGKGNLALGNLNANLGHNQFMATHGLNTIVAGQGLQNQRIGLILQLMEQGLTIQDLINSGYI